MLLPMSPADSVFLIAETRQTPMHFGGLQLFEPPADFPDIYELFAQLVKVDDVAPLFRKRARRSITSAGQWGWEPDAQFDIEHHVRHNALPKPGRILELLALCSRLHGTLLDRERPLWEMHFIEGLADGRFAIYFKIHHALVDGVSGQRVLQRMLTPDPAARDLPAPWANHPEPQRRASDTAPEPRPPMVQLRSVAAEVAGLPGALVKTVNRSVREQSSAISFSAPKSMFNVPISGSRRFAAQSWPLARIRDISHAAGATVNDVVLAACSGALRTYLLSLDALPDSSLIAMVPVALRADERREQGNAVGAVMCNLGTALADPAERLQRVRESMLEGKDALSELTPLQTVAMTGIGMSPLVLQSLPGFTDLFRPPFNIIISNVPGARTPLYLNGARLSGLYPLSIPYHGQALNITCTSYDDELGFGLTGCRRTVPHLQRLLGYLEDEFTALKDAVGIG